jgi:23S rRNA (cytidine2498-2'-O)-methyltransferase
MNPSTAPTLLILTAQPGSDDLALRELRAADPEAHLVAELAPGVLLASVESAFESLAEAWRATPPIFIRHVCPASTSVPLTGAAGDIDALSAAAANLQTFFAPDQAFSVQTRILAEGVAYRPFDVNTALAAAISTTGASLDVRTPARVLSVVVARHAGSLTGFLGASTVRDNLSDWAGGVRRFARDAEQISRSEFKLLEALDVFHIALTPRSKALDLGAAPGGWTRVLRQHGVYVTAVDPAALDPSLMTDPGVRFRRMTAQRYLTGDPDHFDLIVNDMRIDARDAARLVIACARLLPPDGPVITTLKLPEHGQAPLLQEALGTLRSAYTVAGARQLFHNRSEVTAYLRRA